MLKLKQLVVAAAVVLVAAGAMANNFRVADQVYVPVAGHAGGGGLLFLSDVFIQNVENAPVTISYIFIPQGTGASSTPQYFNDVFTLQAGERREIIDFMVAPQTQGGLGLTASANPLGAVVINACLQGQSASCLNPDPTTGVSTAYRNIAVFSRIYSVAGSAPNPQAAPTNGQSFPGIPWYSYASMRSNGSTGGVGDVTKVYVTGFRATPAYRSNLGVMNASQFSQTHLTAKLYRGNAPTTQIGNTREIDLGPLQNFQQSIVAAFGITAAADMTNLFVVFEQTASTATSDSPTGCLPDGCPGYIGFGSVLDNATGDATTLEGIFDKALNDASIIAMFGQKSGGGSLVRRAVRRQ